MSLAPPYVSQWGDLVCNHELIEHGRDPALFRDWRLDGYATVEDYRLWSLNTCGLACLASVLADQGRIVPSKADLVQEAQISGSLVLRDDGRVDGLYYDPFVNWIGRQYRIEAATRAELKVDHIADLVSTGEWYVIASVSSEIRWPDKPPTRKGGHLVLVFDTDDDDIVFHNPSGLGPTAAGARTSRTRFGSFFAQRGVIIRRNTCV